MSDEEQVSRHYTPAGVVEFKYTHSEFVCICSEEGRLNAEMLMVEVCGRLKCTPESLLTHVVMDLAWGFEAAITGLHADQWFGVAAQGKEMSTFIQCDRVEHGVAATWKAFADREKKEEPMLGIT